MGYLLICALSSLLVSLPIFAELLLENKIPRGLGYFALRAASFIWALGVMLCMDWLKLIRPGGLFFVSFLVYYLTLFMMIIIIKKLKEERRELAANGAPPAAPLRESSVFLKAYALAFALIGAAGCSLALYHQFRFGVQNYWDMLWNERIFLDPYTQTVYFLAGTLPLPAALIFYWRKYSAPRPPAGPAGAITPD